MQEVARHLEAGYVAVRAQSGIPGLASTYGVPKGTIPYEPAERGLPTAAQSSFPWQST